MKTYLCLFVIFLIHGSTALKTKSTTSLQGHYSNSSLEEQLDKLYQKFKSNIEAKQLLKDKIVLFSNFSRKANDILSTSAPNNSHNVANITKIKHKKILPFEWTLLPFNKSNSPSQRRGHSMLSTDTNLILFGGCDLNAKCFNDVYFFNIDTLEWTLIENKGKVPSPRMGHSAVLYGNKMIIYGGESNDGFKNDMFEFDIAKKEWKKFEFYNKVATSRANHGAVIDNNGRMFIFGGYSEKGYLNDFFYIDIVNKRYKALTEVIGVPPSQRENFVFEIVNDTIVLFGGFHEGGVLNDVYTFNTSSSTWETIKTKRSPYPMSAMASIALGNKVYITGGCDYRKNKCYSDTYVYDINKKEFSKIKLNREYQSREEFGIGFYKGIIAIFGGSKNDQECYEDMYAMNITEICPNECSGNGKCNENVGCVCDEGFYGVDCMKRVTCRDDCNGKGVCMINGGCSCEEGFKGKFCELEVKCKCVDEKHGECDSNGICKCKEGYEGEDCGKEILQSKSKNVLLEIKRKEDSNEEGENTTEESESTTEEEEKDNSEEESSDTESNNEEISDEEEEIKTFTLKATNETVSTTKGCLNGCSSHGICLNKVCYCEQEYAGDDCSIPINEYKDTGYFLNLVYPYFIYLAVITLLLSLGYNVIKMLIKSKEEFLELNSNDDEHSSTQRLSSNNTIPNNA